MAEAAKLKRIPAHIAYAQPRDEAPRDRDRLIELAMAVCIVGVLSALYIIHGQRAIILAHAANAYASKEDNQVAFLESLALEGAPRNANHGGVVGLAAMGHGATGLTFVPAGDTIFVVNWRCMAASKAEIEQELATGPGATTRNLRERAAQAVPLPAESAPPICQGASRDAQ